MGAAKSIGILFLVLGLITLVGSAIIYGYQMSQDGRIVYQNGLPYVMSANPAVLRTMTIGMIAGASVEGEGVTETMSFKARLLIVDDDPEVLGMLRELLAREAYEVVCAVNGEDALQNTL